VQKIIATLASKDYASEYDINYFTMSALISP